MAHRRLATIGLPVGVGDEANGSIKGEIGSNRRLRQRIEGQKALAALDEIESEEAGY